MVRRTAVTHVRRVVPSADLLGETPLWCSRTGRLWWIDIEQPRLQSFDPASGRHAVHALPGQFLGSLAFRAAGGFLLAIDSALHRYDPDSGRLELFRAVEPDALGNRLNDGRCDAAGRFWVGSMDVGLARPSGAFYRVDPDGTATCLHDGIIVSNTVAIAPDQRTLYHSDTRRFVTWAFDLDADAGTLSRRRVFVDHGAARDRPDGACVDAQGHLWTAIFGSGRIDRYAPDGRRERVVPLPVTNPTCLCFGGPGLATLYVTTARKFLDDAQLAREPWAGSVLAFEPGAAGLPEAMFAG
ncbi:MAG: SMP-30/gluconolactonase/LRE family protein [Alphaproteobacteria bacterium]|nr:SMP-30/gluconolactonase/LRE family protein [Alphaproteobacteria bacterium]